MTRGTEERLDKLKEALDRNREAAADLGGKVLFLNWALVGLTIILVVLTAVLVWT